jgi:CheY-like chemotaxis protein
MTEKMKNNAETILYIPDILIVDDVADNLKILGYILKKQGYKVRPVTNGMLALQVAIKEKPDLILLDIMMPDMDGYEVCRRLKENPKLADIPVIFISALNDTKDIVKALESGGVDYITKPFKAEEVKARVSTHLKLHLQSQTLQRQSKELQELNATKDKFFSIIAHDLRGPLGGFMGLSEMLADESIPFGPDEKREMSLALSQSARNIYNLLENLLEWSQMQRGRTDFNPQLLSLNDAIAECFKTAVESVRKKDIHFIVEISEQQQVYADTNMLQTIIRNLVSNAIKFTPRNGGVAISVSVAENQTVVIAVKDTGIGMNGEMISNLFRINVNCSRPGTEGENSTGLGLLLCKEFVEKHGGELWVESEVGNGSSFYFTLPCHPVQKDNSTTNSDFSSAEAAGKIAPMFSGLKILIAEDNVNSEKLIRILTKTISSELFEASTGVQAVEVCRKNPDIDLVLMDLKMPVMDGLEATRQIRQFNKNVVIIAQTAFGLLGYREIALEAGCDDYLSKPIQKEELMKVIQKYFV